MFVDGVYIQVLLRPMLFVCGRQAYRGLPVTFVYAVLETPGDQQSQQHTFRVGRQVRRLTKMRRQMTSEWLSATDIAASGCISSSATLADVQRQQRQRPVVGNFTRHTFVVANTYEVRFRARSKK